MGAGDAGEALAQLAAARRLFTEGRDARGAARAAIESARALALRGERDHALAVLDEQRIAAKAAGDPDLAARASLVFGEITRDRPAFETALAHFDRYWDGEALARALIGLADSEETPAAEAFLARALEEAAQAGEAAVAGRVLAAIGRLRARRGDAGGADQAYRDAIAALEGRRAGRALAENCVPYGRFLASRGGGAAPACARALSLFRA